MALVNRLLDDLAAETHARLQPHLRLSHLTQGQVLTEAGEITRHVWFPTTSLLSLVGVTTAGHVIELATLGAESSTAVWLVLHASESLQRILVRRAGGAYRLPFEVIEREFHRNLTFERAVARQSVALLQELTQATICVAFHPLLPRLCRWLLVGDDHAHTRTIDLTHEFIAQLLGVTRARVSRALLVLEAQHVIHQGVGRIHILDRDGLEALSCECYRRRDGHGPSFPPITSEPLRA